jgi:hypothetical protein
MRVGRTPPSMLRATVRVLGHVGHDGDAHDLGHVRRVADALTCFDRCSDDLGSECRSGASFGACSLGVERRLRTASRRRAGRPLRSAERQIRGRTTFQNEAINAESSGGRRGLRC